MFPAEVRRGSSAAIKVRRVAVRASGRLNQQFADKGQLEFTRGTGDRGLSNLQQNTQRSTSQRPSTAQDKAHAVILAEPAIF
jgi:hypothetical protein